MFIQADPDGSGELDESEVRGLISSLGVELTDEDLQDAMDQMDCSGIKLEKTVHVEVHVELEEFEQWCDFPIKTTDFPIKTTDFASKTTDFPINTTDFANKTTMFC